MNTRPVLSFVPALIPTLFLLCPLVLLGCSSGGAPDAGPDSSAPDLRPPPDFSPPAPPDLYGGACAGKAGQRLCAMDQLSSGVCDDKLMFQPDRACQGNGCSGGYCNLPGNGVKCQFDADCQKVGQGSLYCQIFTNEFNLYSSYCAPAAGPGAPLSTCQKDTDCQSNFCVPLAQGQVCAKMCKGDGDCDGSPNSCGPSTLLIEGFRNTVGVCVR